MSGFERLGGTKLRNRRRYSGEKLTLSKVKRNGGQWDAILGRLADGLFLGRS
jgi:hypothetical protein